MVSQCTSKYFVGLHCTLLDHPFRASFVVMFVSLDFMKILIIMLKWFKMSRKRALYPSLAV